MPTLNLKYHKPTSVHKNGLWLPADHESQRLALMHFSGGSEAISYDRLDEITYVAGMHGWCTSSEGHPARPSPENVQGDGSPDTNTQPTR